MIWDIIKFLVSLPASVVAVITLARLARPGKGRHEKP